MPPRIGGVAGGWAFELDLGETTIDTIDPDGVALAAIQGLHTLVQEKDEEIASNEARISL